VACLSSSPEMISGYRLTVAGGVSDLAYPYLFDDGSIAGIANCGILMVQGCSMCVESIARISNLWLPEVVRVFFSVTTAYPRIGNFCRCKIELQTAYVCS
jgi:hypothetical protein